MEVLKQNEQSVEIVLTSQDVESAVRQFICTCHPEFAKNWVLNPKYDVLKNTIGSVTFTGKQSTNEK